MEYTAVYQKMDNGWYFAQCEQMPNAITQAATIEEAEQNLKEVITLLIECQTEEGLKKHSSPKFFRKSLANFAFL